MTAKTNYDPTVPCGIDGCDYTHAVPQGMGLHKRRAHNVVSPTAGKRAATKRRKKSGPLPTDDLVTVVLEQMFPSGIPVEKFSAVARWRDATLTFMKEMS